MKSRICSAGKGAISGLTAETGQALVLALVVVVALSISAAGLVVYTTSNDNSFSRDRDVTRATAIAEAGIQNAMSVISQYDADTSKCVYSGGSCPAGRLPVSGTTSYSADGGTGTWYATKTQASTGPNIYAIWAISATATSPDGRVTRTVEANSQALPPLTVVLPIFNYALYVGGTGAAPSPSTLCNGDIVNNTSVSGDFVASGNMWIGNNLCVSGNTSVTPPTDNGYAVYVNGAVQIKGSSNLGSSSKKFKTATLINGCYDASGPVSCSNTTKSKVFAYAWNVGSSFTQSSQKPPIDWTVQTAANWNDPAACTGLSPSNLFETSGESYTNPIPTRTLTLDNGGTNYSCTFTDGSGTFVGSISYTSGQVPPLTINGKVFMNANLNLTSNIAYQGNGTIYVNGIVTSRTDVCGFPTTVSGNSCSGTWNQDLANLEIVAMNAGNCPKAQTTPCTVGGWTSNANGEIDLIAFIRGGLLTTGNGGSSDNFKGPLLTDFVDKLRGGGGAYYPSAPPVGSEGVTQVPQPWALIPGSWRQLTNP